MRIAHMMRRTPEKIQRGLELAREVYSYSNVGGHLHIAIDDGNMTDDNLLFCIDHCLKALDDPDDYWDPRYEIRVAAYLLTCTYAERLTIYKNMFAHRSGQGVGE